MINISLAILVYGHIRVYMFHNNKVDTIFASMFCPSFHFFLLSGYWTSVEFHDFPFRFDVFSSENVNRFCAPCISQQGTLAKMKLTFINETNRIEWKNKHQKNRSLTFWESKKLNFRCATQKKSRIFMGNNLNSELHWIAEKHTFKIGLRFRRMEN